jgi:CRP-like cAMP-binding protein
MNMVSHDSARANRILGALPLSDYMPLAGQFEPVQLQAGQVIEAAGASHGHVHFPVSCAVTLVSATRDGDMSELALIGREGLVGMSAVLGGSGAGLQSVVLRPGLAYRLPVAVFGSALQRSAPLQAMALRYVQSLMVQMAQGVVCSLHHSVLQRLSTWLLVHQTVTASQQVQATHETIAHMLGVRRESITQAAGQLQQAGCITTSRGRITIDDPQALRGQVCECFGQIEQDHQQLWQTPVQSGAQSADGLSCWSAPETSAEAQGLVGTQAPVQANGRYADIYDFAPVGLLSVDSQGRLIETNMAAAIQLGIPRSQCRQYRFVDFLQAESREAFERFHREVLSGKCRRHCELGLLPAGRSPAAVVRLDATVDENGEENRMVMVDITDSHRQMAQLLHGHGREAGLTPPQRETQPWWHAGQEGASAARAGRPAGL